MPSLLTIAEFQRDYNVSRSTVYRLRERGEIRFVKIGRSVRIPREVAANWFAKLTGEANDA
jgi:excisionase family DNA binding protein